MPPRKVQIQGPDGKMTDAYETGVAESTEKFSEYTLEDGTVLKGKLVVLSAARLEGQYDQDGNPSYQIKAQQLLIVVSAPDELKKKVQ